MVLIGDVRGRTCVIVDDMIDTAGTLCTAADLLKNEGGAKDVYAFATHGLFSGAAGDKIATSSLSKVITTDSVLIDPSFRAKVGAKFEQVSLDLLLAEAIRRTH
jgi:ribose-phosphate pyrophosphokinase